MENILALDLSTKRSGWAVYQGPDTKIEYGVIASASTSVEKRIGVMRDGIIDIIKEYNIKKIIIEEVRPDGYNNHTGKVLTWLQGCIVIAAYEYDKHISIEFIGPSSWRSILGLQGYRIQRAQQKQMDISYANNLLGIELTAEQDDEADAICILYSFVKNEKALVPKQKLGAIGSDESAF